jgi:hypothetical protein
MKRAIFVSTLLILTHTLYANPYIDLGLSLGTLAPQDSKMLESFGRDFYIQGHLGARDKTNGFEIRGNLGHYSSMSHNSKDIGTDTKLDITPLTASLIYHIGNENATIQPYIGGGFGAYFYNMHDQTYHNLVSGTRFGSHLLGGIKMTITPSFYIGIEYTQTFASPIIFNQSQNFDQQMISFSFGLLSAAESSKKAQKENSEEYANLLLSQINDLTIEVQKIKENKSKVEERINAFYESNSANEYVPLFDVLDQGIVGQKVLIIHPRTKETLAEGTLATVENSNTEIRALLQNKNGWQLPLTIQKMPAKLRIGQTDYPDLNDTEIKRAIQIERIRNDQEFAQELRRVQYLEDQLERIEKALSSAESQLKSYHEQWKETQPKEDTVIRIEESYRYPTTPTHFYRRPTPYNYRYYRPQDYVAPVYVPGTPPSAEEKERFIEAKKERIREIRNR